MIRCPLLVESGRFRDSLKQVVETAWVKVSLGRPSGADGFLEVGRLQTGGSQQLAPPKEGAQRDRRAAAVVDEGAIVCRRHRLGPESSSKEESLKADETFSSRLQPLISLSAEVEGMISKIALIEVSTGLQLRTR